MFIFYTISYGSFAYKLFRLVGQQLFCRQQFLVAFGQNCQYYSIIWEFAYFV